jgi:protein tyrosine phosphatase (PTP) superfamily phosphohydrolase (DUF442 family)
LNFLQNIAIQFAFLYAPLVHCVSEQVTPVLYRGPDPKVKDIYALHDKGVKTIISLRTHPERDKERLCEKLGMKWVQIKTGVFKTPSADQFDQFRSIVNDPKQQPVYASCEIDMDRTGVYIAAMRMVDQHWTEAQMNEEFREHHQKRWWPIFRKYQRVVTEYADSRLAKLPSGSPNSNSDLATVKESDETLSVNAKKLVK